MLDLTYQDDDKQRILSYWKKQCLAATSPLSSRLVILLLISTALR